MNQNTGTRNPTLTGGHRLRHRNLSTRRGGHQRETECSCGTVYVATDGDDRDRWDAAHLRDNCSVTVTLASPAGTQAGQRYYEVRCSAHGFLGGANTRGQGAHLLDAHLVVEGGVR